MRAAVIGFGSIGRRYVRLLCEEAVEVGVLDIDPDKTAAAARDNDRVHVFSDIADLLTWQPAAVIVATPPEHHETAVYQPLKAGCSILLEKPIAHSMSAAKRIVELHRESSATMFGVCNMRFHPGPHTVFENMNAIGNPLFAVAYYGHLLEQQRPTSLSDTHFSMSTDRGGGAILDCIHEIDLQNWVFGRGEVVGAQLANLHHDMMRAEDYAVLQTRHARGVHVSIHLDFLQRRKRRGWAIHGTEGSLIWESEGKQPEECRVRLLRQSESTLLFEDNKLDVDEPYRRMLRAFFQCIENPASDCCLQTSEEAVAALTMALSINYNDSSSSGWPTSR